MGVKVGFEIETIRIKLCQIQYGFQDENTIRNYYRIILEVKKTGKSLFFFKDQKYDLTSYHTMNKDHDKTTIKGRTNGNSIHKYKLDELWSYASDCVVRDWRTCKKFRQYVTKQDINLSKSSLDLTILLS